MREWARLVVLSFPCAGGWEENADHGESWVWIRSGYWLCPTCMHRPAGVS